MKCGYNTQIVAQKDDEQKKEWDTLNKKGDYKEAQNLAFNIIQAPPGVSKVPKKSKEIRIVQWNKRLEESKRLAEEAERKEAERKEAERKEAEEEAKRLEAENGRIKKYEELFNAKDYKKSLEFAENVNCSRKGS